jgi:hypothetical protein
LSPSHFALNAVAQAFPPSNCQVSLARAKRQSPGRAADAAEAQDGQVDLAIAIDVEGVGAVDVREVRDWVLDPLEPERGADRAVVPVQRRRIGPSRHEHVGPAVGIAVEHGDATSDRGREVAVVDVIDAGLQALLHEVRSHRHGRRRRTCDEEDRNCAHYTQRDAKVEPDLHGPPVRAASRERRANHDPG